MPDVVRALGDEEVGYRVGEDAVFHHAGDAVECSFHLRGCEGGGKAGVQNKVSVVRHHRPGLADGLAQLRGRAQLLQLPAHQCQRLGYDLHG